MTSPVPVLEVINESSLGGGQSQLLALATGLPADRFAVEVAAGPGGPLVGRLEAAGIPFHPLPFADSIPWRLLRQIRCLVARHGHGIVHSHGGVAGFWVRIACLGLPVRTIHTLHGIHYLHFEDRVKGFAYRTVDRLLRSAADRIVCVSEADGRKGLEAGVVLPGQLRVVVNGIDPFVLDDGPDRRATRSTLGWSESDPIVGCIARFHRQKDLGTLIKALSHLVARGHRVRVALAGSGPEEQSLRSLTDRLDLRGDVLFLGPRTDIGPLYRAFDLFCLPSLWEGLPLALLEALSQGLPIVASDIDGVNEIVTHEVHGLLVTPGDPRQVADSIERLLRDPELARRLGQAGQSRVRSEFTSRKMVEKTMAVYEELISS